MSLPELAIRRPVFAWMLMAAVVVFGMISFQRLGISQLPDVDFPVVSVSITLNGAAPEVIESQVLDPIEDAIMEIDGIKSVTSTAQQSSGSIAVEFELNQNIDRAMEEIQNKIDQVRNLLPLNLFPPTLRKSNPEDSPIIWLVLTSDDPNTKKIDLMIYARNFLYDQFGVVPGIGNIALGGYVDPALRVWMDLKKLNHYNITADDVLSSIEAEQLETPAGQINGLGRDYNVRVMGEAASPEDFGKIRIENRANQGPNYLPTQLNQVANIEEGIADVRKISRFNGHLAVGLGMIKQHGSNAVEVADAIRAKAKEIAPLLPPHFHIDVRSDSTRFIKQSVHQLLFTLMLSALLTSLVCYLFLGSWTSTINVLFSIPTSIIGTFIAFYAFNFTLNTFTLLGLSLAIGIVVDDAIMMLENIVRHRELGESKKGAAIKGANEISFAAMAATIAVCAIFVPVVFMKGIIGRYFFQYGITVTVAVLLSLLEALTLTPMRCSRYLRVEHNPRGLAGFMDRVFVKLSNGYRSILNVLLSHRWPTVAAAIALFIGSLFISKLIPGEMMPAQDQSQMMLRFKLPVGTALGVTDDRMKEVEKYLLKVPEVEGIFSAVGGFGGDAVNQGQVFVNLVDPDKRKLTQTELIKKIRGELKKKMKGMEVVVQDLSLRGFAATRGFPVEFIIQGPNWDLLTSTTKNIMDKMKESKYLVDVNTDVQQNMPEVQLIPDRVKMASHAVSLATVTNQLNELVGGQIITGANEYPKGRHRYEIEIRLDANQRDALPDLDKISLRNNRGETVRLADVVTETRVPSLMLISRLNRARAITVYANPAPGHSQDEAIKNTEALAKSMLPPGYIIKMIGSSQSFKESFQSLIYAMILGLLVSYMVLASQFDSFIHPVTVLMALPFSFSGAFFALWIGHQSINMYSLIGFILLMGIVKKNSILLVDFTNQVRNEGLGVRESLLKACPVRLRPILMTSTATVAGALPEALSLGPGAETTIPMAIAIIGGVIASTLLTLFVVPVVYSLFSRWEQPDPLIVEERNKAIAAAAAAAVNAVPQT
jgi:hydrophobe/amphiphile efflux-1 (HAE1) family protein